MNWSHSIRMTALVTGATLAATLTVGCGGDGPSTGGSDLTGTVAIDGSSTVFLISEAVAEEFQKGNPGVRVTVGLSGTGGGFKKMANKEIDIADASRPIKASEVETITEAGVELIELPVAYDGLSVVVNAENDWVDHLTVAELKAIWEPGSQVKSWSQVRAGFPDVPLTLYGPGTDSGTFDYFTEAVCGEEGASRPDYNASEDDNTLVQGVSGDAGAMAYFGFAYYEENKDKLKIVPIDGGTGPIAPSPETINDGSYAPLSRPLFIYVRKDSMDRPEMQAFLDFYLQSAPELSRSVGYIAMPDRVYTLVKDRLDRRVTGSAYEGISQVGITVEDILAREGAG